MRNAYKISVGKPVGKRPLGKPRNRWKNNIKMVLKEVRLTVWTGFKWLRVSPMAVPCEQGNEPSCSIKDGEFLD
jgi:hypothetical protein